MTYLHPNDLGYGVDTRGRATPPPPPELTPIERAHEWLASWVRLRATVDHYGGDVYFLQHETGGFIKIGVSVHIPSRLKSLNAQTHDPRYRILASMPGAGNLYERLFHDCFTHLREHGEWFRPEQDLLAFIEAVKAASNA